MLIILTDNVKSHCHIYFVNHNQDINMLIILSHGSLEYQSNRKIQENLIKVENNNGKQVILSC